MNDKYEELKEYSSGSLLIAAVRNLFEKKAACLTVSAVAVVVSLFVMNIVSQYYGTAVWWANCLFNLPFFTMFIAGVGGIVSNIGKFSVRRFTVASTVCAIVMWAVMSVRRVIGMAFLPIDWALYWKAIGLDLLEHLPLPVISLAIVLLPVMISARGKNA